MLFLEERCFDNLVAYWKSLAVNPITSDEEYTYINTGIQNSMFNPIFAKQTAESAPPKLTNMPHSFWHDNKRNQKIHTNDISMEPIMEHVPVMSIRLDKEFKQHLPPNITIEIIENGNDLSDWVLPVQVAFQMDDEMALHYRRRLEQASEQFVNFIVKHDKQTVAAASLFLSKEKEIAGLYNLSVLPEYRKQGIGTALHYARLNEARSRGYQYATLQATPMASELDKAIGFQTHSELTIYKR